MFTSENLPDGQNHTTKPEFFRLPRSGVKDPYFGLSRTAYYELEKLGAIRLVRLRKRGNIRGITLIPFDQMSAYVRRSDEDR
jgi:hypothetical protein